MSTLSLFRLFYLFYDGRVFDDVLIKTHYVCFGKTRIPATDTVHTWVPCAQLLEPRNCLTNANYDLTTVILTENRWCCSWRNSRWRWRCRQFASKIPKTFLLRCALFVVDVEESVKWSCRWRWKFDEDVGSKMLKSGKGKVRKSTLESGNWVQSLRTFYCRVPYLI